MNEIRDRFWEWATESFVRFGTVVVVVNRIIKTRLKGK